MSKASISRVIGAAALLLGLAAAARASSDAFGIRQLYPTVSGGKEWRSNWANGVPRTFGWGDDPQDSWFHGKGDATYRIDGKGLLSVSGPVPRMYIYDPALARSFRDVEMTVYAKRVSDSGTAYGGIVGAARTNHLAEATKPCDTRGIIARFRYDGHIDLEKETKHPYSVAVQNKSFFPGGLPYNQWIGYKLVVYDLPNGNVRIESYMDLADGVNGGTWVKVNEIEDTGSNFGVGGKGCRSGVNPALRLTKSDQRQGSETGKPNQAVYWRSDNVGTNGLVYKRMSVREIAPIASDMTAPRISGVSVPAIGQSSATVAWMTDEASDTQIEYGLTSSYGSASAVNPALTTSHGLAIGGLSPGTLYHFRAKSRDAAGNLAVSQDATFTTFAQAPPASCIDSSGAWSNAPLAQQSGTFIAEFDATPGMARMDGVSGLSNGAASAYTGLAAAVRFNNAGLIDARNGGGYAAASAIPYSPNLTYHFRLIVNLGARTYSAYVRQGSATERLIGDNFAFRGEQSGVTVLNNLGLLASAGSLRDCNAVATASQSSPSTGYSLTDDFSAYPRDACLPDSAVFGPWTSLFGGYGCTQVKSDGTRFWLDESPQISVSPSETHASFVLGPSVSEPLTFSVDLQTKAQLRINSPPNPWEVAWVSWNYTDNARFYYFIPKPNGWELGKADPAYPGAQRFLATGSSPVFPIGAWYTVKIEQALNVITIYVDGQKITTFTDLERPYTSGRIGLYNEDANARFTNVAVNPGVAIARVLPAAADESARAPQRFLSPGLADGINDAATFGLGAQEVSIYSLRGLLVFHTAQRSGAPIVWDCRDGSGRIRESGIYIARIRRSDSSVLYQSFALVK